MQILEWHQRINVVPVPHTEYFFQFGENEGRFINRSFKVLTKWSSYCTLTYKKLEGINIALIGPVFVQNRCFIQVFKQLYEIVANSLQYVCKIPWVDKELVHSRLFPKNGELYMNNGNTLYKLVGDDFQQVGKEGLRLYFCYLDRYVYQSGSSVFDAYNRLVASECDIPVFAQSGVALFQNATKNRLTAISLLDLQVVTVQSGQITPSSIHDYLELCESGFSLKAETLLKLFGDTFAGRRADIFKDYCNQYFDPAHQKLIIDQLFSEFQISQLALKDEKHEDLVKSPPERNLNLVPIACTRHFLQFSDNRCRLLDNDLNVITEFITPCPQSLGQRLVLTPYTFNAVGGGGKWYLQIFDKVYEVVGNQLKFVIDIPDMNILVAKNIHHRIFYYDDTLYISNAKKLFKLVDGKLKHASFETGATHVFYMQFLNSVFAVKWGMLANNETMNATTFVTYNNGFGNSMDVPFRISVNMPMLYHVGPVAVFHNSYTSEYYIVNILANTVQVSKDRVFDISSLRNNLELYVFGLSLNRKILAGLYGDQFIAQLESLYVQWHGQMSARGLSRRPEELLEKIKLTERLQQRRLRQRRLKRQIVEARTEQFERRHEDMIQLVQKLCYQIQTEVQTSGNHMFNTQLVVDEMKNLEEERLKYAGNDTKGWKGRLERLRQLQVDADLDYMQVDAVLGLLEKHVTE